MNLILDMDGTLIDNSGKGFVRPYLHEFLLFCFEHFDTVSIWTAAILKWFEHINTNILQPILDKISNQLGRQCRFHFIFTRDRCAICPNGFVKPLRKIWCAKTLYPTFNKHNTIIIDDSPVSYKYNYGNAVPIAPYMGDMDYELVKAKFLLSDMLLHFSNHETIRNMDKQFWFYNIEYTHFSQLTIVIWQAGSIVASGEDKTIQHVDLDVFKIINV